MSQVLIDGTAVLVTEKSAQVRVEFVDGKELFPPRTVFFPFSMCPDVEEAEPGEEIEFLCPEWLADKEDLLDD